MCHFYLDCNISWINKNKNKFMTFLFIKSDRPVMYAGVGGPAWGQIKLPHQVLFLSLFFIAI